MTPKKTWFFVWNASFLQYILPACLVFVSVFALYKTTEARAIYSAFIPWEPHPIVIDAGHGGYDPGVMTNGGQITEKALTLAIAQKLEQQLKQAGIATALTRETDQDFAQKGSSGKTAKRQDLNYRIDFAHSVGAGAFVSIHVNNSPLATRGGAEVFYNADVPGAKELASAIQGSLHQIPGMTRRDAKPQTYYLLRKMSIPAVIVEVGYLNIPSERIRLQSPSYQELLAKAITTGIQRWLKETNAGP